MTAPKDTLAEQARVAIWLARFWNELIDKGFSKRMADKLTVAYASNVRMSIR